VITYQYENFTVNLMNEIEPLLLEHWKELALDQNTITLEPDWAAYWLAKRNNNLCVITARSDVLLIGYYVGFIKPHLHYKNSLTAYNDIYWIHPDYRQGMTGIKFLKYIEEFMKNAGVQRIIMNTKAHLDKSPIFERLGYRPSDIVYTKVLG